jgi:hypothetical protein
LGEDVNEVVKPSSHQTQLKNLSMGKNDWKTQEGLQWKAGHFTSRFNGS